MKLTLEMIDNESAAHVMRILSEDVLEALRDGTLPDGDGEELTWHHPCGVTVSIREMDNDPDSTSYYADVHAPGNFLSGGFTLFDEGAADALDERIEAE